MAQQPDSDREISVYVGRQIRRRRKALKISMETLGPQLGITWQQLSKYEKGINRVGAPRLYRLAEILDVPLDHFFPERSSDAP